MERLIQNILYRPRFDDKTAQHDPDAVADVVSRRQVVRDVNDADLLFIPQLAEQVDDFHTQGGIDHRNRLIGKDQFRLGNEGACDRDTLNLPTGQLVRVAPGQLLQPGEREHLVHPAAAFGPGQLVETEADVAGDVEVREERVVLEDQPDAAAFGDAGAYQCSYCIPAMALTAHAALRADPTLTCQQLCEQAPRGPPVAVGSMARS